MRGFLAAGAAGASLDTVDRRQVALEATSTTNHLAQAAAHPITDGGEVAIELASQPIELSEALSTFLSVGALHVHGAERCQGAERHVKTVIEIG